MDVFNQRNWTLELEAGKPQYLPVPKGSPCIINGIYATDTSETKIVLKAIIQIIRIDKIGEDDDTAQSEIVSPVLATIFPSINPSQSVHIEFSALNVVTVNAIGGNLILNGIYDNSCKLPELGEI